jgi:hypothetical protein
MVKKEKRRERERESEREREIGSSAQCEQGAIRNDKGIVKGFELVVPRRKFEAPTNVNCK